MERLENLLKVFNPHCIKPGLSRIKEFLRKIGNPQQKLNVILVGGTNGKGSVCNFLTDILVDNGYKVGTFTSPHIFHVNERIKINQKPYLNLYPYAKEIFERCETLTEKPTYFEFLTALAYLVFAQEKVDFAIMEVGLGGRFDAVNVVRPLLSVIVTISKDHTEFLGNEISQIAYEKAGIIHEKIPVFTGFLKKEALGVIKERAKQKNCLFYPLKQHYIKINKDKFSFSNENINIKNIKLSMKGRNQIYNASLSMHIASNLNIPIKKGIIEKSFWPARIEIIKNKRKTVIIDGCHNVESAIALSDFLKNYKQEKTLIFSALKDKDTKGMLKILLPHFSDVKIIKINNERAIPTHILCHTVQQLRFKGNCKTFPSLNEAFLHTLLERDFIVICGSLYLIPQAKACLLKSCRFSFQ
ncbi:MAG: bifunctional folylpolyglutamate synthase/dihydrofolate synthase [Deltaproteobacteria bacterium]|nr:bifunctional folylpolyglutamate synthase/dihydrofolate synthase [Deltaproteobacteria bacterium]